MLFVKCNFSTSLPSLVPLSDSTPKRILKQRQVHRAKHGVLPTDNLVKSYMRRYDMRLRLAHPLTVAQREEARYAKLLGIDPSDENSAMGRKSSVLDHAYQFAIRQYEVLRMNEDHGMTEKESVSVVEELLAKEASKERQRTRKKADEAKKWREARDATNATEEFETKEALGKKENLSIHEEDKRSETPPDAVVASSVPSILAGKPWAIQAMTMWLRRLNGVIYYICTFGYSTILDLYISIDVLGMSEDT